MSRRGPRYGATHPLLKSTAEEMASALFEAMMQDNRRFWGWKEQFPGETTEELRKRFVGVTWARLLPQARETLAGMLRNSMLAEEQKTQIADALILDAPYHQGRMEAQKYV